MYDCTGLKSVPSMAPRSRDFISVHIEPAGLPWPPRAPWLCSSPLSLVPLWLRPALTLRENQY
jgi:hypothetical protein